MVHNFFILSFIAWPISFISTAPSLTVYTLLALWLCIPQGMQGKGNGEVFAKGSKDRCILRRLAMSVVPLQQFPPPKDACQCARHCLKEDSSSSDATSKLPIDVQSIGVNGALRIGVVVTCVPPLKGLSNDSQ